jgi:hypothetical protein
MIMLTGEQLANIQKKLIDRFMVLIELFLDELASAPTKGQYNKMFGTYSKSQNDIKRDYKGRLDAVMGMMTHFKIDTTTYKSMVPTPDVDTSILGDIGGE